MSILRTVVAVAIAFACSLASAQRSTPVQVLHPSGATSDWFGESIAVDGDTMIVGAALDDVGANVNQGSANVYRWTGAGWTLEATLTAIGGLSTDEFGISVAISGDTAIVGAWSDDVGGNLGQGSAYVFTRTGTTWTQQSQLIATGGAPSDQFGWSVSISGDTAIVGALFDDVGANGNQGSAYVFTRTGTTWNQQAQLTATGGAANDNFGVSVGISGDTAIVGAYLGDAGTNADQGSAYIFTRTGATWTQQAQLTATGGAAGDQFGSSVAISGDTAIVGATGDDVGANNNQGSAYVFARSGTSWTQQAQLTATGGAAGDQFGRSVSVSGDSAIVGADTDDVGPNGNQGSAFVFARSGAAWNQQAQLVASDGAGADGFGKSVSISGDIAVVGAILDDVTGFVDQGSAWVFARVGNQWIGPDLTLVASGGLAGDQVGFSVAISGDTAIVGASADDVGANSNQGSALIFVRTGTTWTQQAQLFATGGAAGDQFGSSVAISGDTAIVGTPFDDVGANVDQGSAYIFTRTGTTWTQQAQVTATGGAAGESFGSVVAISGDTVMVGVARDDVGANLDQGSAFVFVRSGAAWTQQAQLVASDGAPGDYFGSSVAISGDTAIVGAYLDDVGAIVNQGSAYVFTRSGTTWIQRARLIASDGATEDAFGQAVAISGDSLLVGAYPGTFSATSYRGSAYVFIRTAVGWTQQARLAAADGATYTEFATSVAISGDTAIVGARRDDVGSNADQGSAYVFTRTGTTWMQRARLTTADGASSDGAGWAVAISGGTVIVGVPSDDVGFSADQGSVGVLSVVADDLSLTSNDVTGATYPTLAAALLPAAAGQQLAATEGAWRQATIVDTAGRSIVFAGKDDIRMSPQSVITLGGSSSMLAPAGAVIDLNGQVRVSTGSSADLYADSFRLGSRGIMTARTNASLSINAPTAKLDGQTRLEQGASLTFAGSAEAIGSTTCAFESTLTAGTSFTNIDTFTITAGTINAPLFWNRAQFNVFGTSAIFGSLLNNAGATTTIRSGTLFVFGDLINNGTVIGTICSTCSGLPPGMDVGGTLSLGPAANLTMPFVGSVVHIGGSFDCAINANTRFDMAQATLQVQSARPEVTLEVMSADIGVDALGLDRSLPGHFPIGELHIGNTPTTVRLVDAHDNALDGTGACEALYVDTLRIDAGSRLINTTCRVYYNTLVNAGTVDAPENLIPLQGTPCPADFNADGGVDGADVVDFFAAWEAGESTADVNLDGGVDGGDIDVFFAAWEAGGC
jgi:hypothetical protein